MSASTSTPPRQLDRFGIVLVLVAAAIVSQSLVDFQASPLGSLVVHAFNGAALVLAVRAAGVHLRWRRVADVLVAVSLLANAVLLLLDRLGDGPDETIAGPEYLWLVAACAVPVVVARRVAHHDHVTGRTVIGAVAAYLQIGVAFAMAYQVLDYTAGPIFGQDVPTTTYMYFSLTSITTVGYGDVSATTEAARLLAVSEAVIGQVYLVTFVAFIVGRFARRPSGGPTE
jgi:hypothetical protein